DPVAVYEFIQRRFELRAAFAYRRPDVAAASNRDVRMYGEPRKNLFPEIGLVLVNDDERDETGVEHLEQILVFQCLGGLLDFHWRLLCRHELLVEGDDALVVARRLAHEH